MNKWLGFSFPVCKFNHNNVIKEDATEIENEDTTEIIVGFPFFSRPADCRVNRIYNWSNQVHGWIGGHPLLPYVNTFYFLWYRFQREGGGGNCCIQLFDGCEIQNWMARASLNLHSLKNCHGCEIYIRVMDHCYLQCYYKISIPLWK